MSSFSSLFVLNSDGDLEINRLEVKRIPEFKILFDRDLGSNKDAGGKRKYIASAEIYYIYLITDIRSLYYNLPLAERKLKAIKDANLPNNWKHDKEVDNAIEVYKSIFKLTAAGSAYVVAEKLYFSVTKDTEDLQEDISYMKEQLRGVTKKLKARVKPGEIELVSLLGDAQALIKGITAIQKDMLNNVKTFADLGNTVKTLATKFMEEGGNLKTPVGGGQLNNREL